MQEELRQCLKCNGDTGVFFLCLELSGPLDASGTPGRTGLDIAGSGSLWENPRGEALNSAWPFIPTHQKDKSQTLKVEELKNQLLHFAHFDNEKEAGMVPFLWAK